MTLDEMKLAVCAKLSGVVDVSNDGQGPCYWPDRHTKEINWPTEGLQVCHEAEKVLTHPQKNEFFDQLQEANGTKGCVMSTYSQRLEALCRVWYPERFTT